MRLLIELILEHSKGRGNDGETDGAAAMDTCLQIAAILYLKTYDFKSMVCGFIAKRTYMYVI